jgi:hypothetical protein
MPGSELDPAGRGESRVGDQTSLFPSALLLGFPPIGLLASLPPTASPLCHATEEGISLRGQEERKDPFIVNSSEEAHVQDLAVNS